MKSKTLKRALAGLLILLCVVSAFSAGIINTAAVELDSIEPLNNSFAVVSPVPSGSTIEPITQPARLDTLQGKTIALVGGSFSASVTHAILRDMLEDEFGCKTYYMDEIGKGGTFNPNNPSAQSKEFQQKLKSMGVDAVISGNCGCGICTVKETGNALAAEYIGIPAVVGAETFIAQIESTGYNRGVSVVRTAAYPGAFAADTTEEQERKARDILYNQVVTGLTTEITQAEIDRIAGAIGSTQYDDVIFTGSYQRIQEFFEVNEMTDAENVYAITKEFSQDTYTFKVNEGTIWYGNAGTFTDSAMRWTMSSTTSENCTFTATGGTYTFTTTGNEEFKALVSIDNTAQEAEGIRVYYSWYTPVEQADFTHQAAGLIYVSEADYVADNFIMGATGVQKATTSNEVAAGSANARKRMTTGETWYFRAWVQYLDADGNVCVEYSDAVKTTMA